MRSISASELSNLGINPVEVHHSTSDPAGEHRIIYLTTDSRTVTDPASTAFAAVKTGVNDGHRYIPGLYKAGVRVFIVEHLDDELRNYDATFIVVNSAEEALRLMAMSRIENYTGGIIITGSHGKTKTKELIFRTLLRHSNAVRSPRSWNSSIGVPLAIWDMTIADDLPDHMLTEVAIDGPGQGEKISALLSGSHRIGIITPLTTEHDEAFPSHDDKVREKVDIVRRCSTIVYADTDPELRRQLEELPDAVLYPVTIDSSLGPTIYHALAATVCTILEVSQDNISVIKQQSLVDMRRRIAPASNGNNIIRDLFTTDLRSLADALLFFSRHCDSTRKKVLILGDMIANGSEGNLAHTYSRVLDLCRNFGVSNLVFTGSEALSVKPSLPISDNILYAGDSLITDIEAGRSWHDSDILIFGEKSVIPYLDALESAAHDTSLEVDLDALIHNYNHYRRLVKPGTEIIAMVKASGYGMGAVEIGKALQNQGAAYLAVAVVDEGIALRDAGVSMPVMVLNPITNRHRSLFTHRLEPAVFSLGELSTLCSEAAMTGVKSYPIHIKIDTGMHRVGFLEQDIQHLAAEIKKQTQLRVASVFTHLATADCLDMDSYSLGQITAFNRAADSLETLLGYKIKRHYLNTAGMMRFADNGNYDMARLGIGLYGVSPYKTTEASHLQPVAALRTRIISIKHWPDDTPVGYGCKGRTKGDSIIATIPIGYADGINRHLGCGNASFIVNGTSCPTVGNICMDQCMIDVSAAPDPKVGDSVEVFGPSQPVEILAQALDTIPYEILTSVSPRVKRTYLKR